MNRQRVTAFVGLLALTALAAIAWLPGAVDGGFRPLGVSISALLSLAVAVGVSLAAFVLSSSARLPRAVRAVILVLAFYSVVALLSGMAAGVPFRELFSGGSFWQPLPFFLQGATIGGLIVLPAALLAAAIRVGTRHPRPGSTEHALYQAVALATTFAIVVATLPQRTNAATTQAGSSRDDAARRVAILDNSLRAIEDGHRESARDRWDPAFVVEQVGKDPAALFAWLRDNTAWIPYRGTLRGPIGVLMDRQGNSLDRAILLARLLEAAGHTARIARGELSRKQALELLPDLIAWQSARVMTVFDPDLESEPDVRTVAAQYELNGEEIERGINEQGDRIAQLVIDIQTRVANQAGRLLAAVPRPDAGTEWLARYHAALEAIRDHWWVQYEEHGVWSDLDALASAGSPSLVSAQDTFAPNAIPSELRHDVAVRVVVEHWSNGPLAESRLLEYALRPDELLGQPVNLQFWPRSMPGELHPDPNSPLGLKRVALEQREWSAVLVIGRDVVAQTVIHGVADNAAEPATGNPMGGLGGAISGLARQPQTASAPVRELTAAWIEYEIRAPGAPARSIRRAVFDLLGTAARSGGSVPQLALTDEQRLTRSLSLMMRTEILAAPSEFAQEFTTHLAAQSLAGNRDVLRAIARDELEPGDAATEHLLNNAAPAVTPLYSFALARSEWSPVRDRLLADRLAIFTRHRYPAFAGQNLVLRDGIDIVANEMGVTLAEPDAFTVRVEQGVFDTIAEAAVLQLAGRQRGNTAHAFDASQDWIVVTAAQGSAANDLDLPADAERAIAEDVGRGYSVVAPTKPIEIDAEPYSGWWRIDSATGDTLGMAANGWGQAMAERGVQYNVMVEWAKTFAFEYAFCQAVPQVMNQAVAFLQPYRNELPPWLPPLAITQDAGQLYNANKKQCLIGAMIGTGVTATLPLMLIFIRATAARWAGPLARFWRDQRGGFRIPPSWVRRPTPGLIRRQARGGPIVPEGAASSPGTTDPLGKTQPDLSRTQYDPGSAPAGPAQGAAPGTPSTPLSREAAQQNLSQAKAAQAAAEAESVRATQDFVRYRVNKPNPARDHAGDPSKWDPVVDEALQNEMWQKQQQNSLAVDRVKEAQRADTAAAAAARKAQGASGLGPALQRAPSPKLPGCPPNCGNNNPTGPAADVQIIVGGGGLSGGGT